MLLDARIAVLASGGVDSSLALAKLAQTYTGCVMAVYLRVWLEDEASEDILGDCPWEQDLKYVLETAHMLGVSTRVLSMQLSYKQEVVEPLLAGIKAGITPNPDILCNRHIKFGKALEMLRAEGFTHMATGHYARISHPENGDPPQLLRAADDAKDQTYFLSRVPSAALAGALFPLGDSKKSDVRQQARALGLPAADRPDSQGVCFLGKFRFRDFVRAHLGTRAGDLVEQETGKKLGRHEGHFFFTRGQREGIGLGGGPFFVTGKDAATNTVFISKVRSPQTGQTTFALEQENWLPEMPPAGEVQVRVRHAPELLEAHWHPKNKTIVLKQAVHGAAPGQIIALYRGARCLGGGVIQSAT